MISDTLDDYTGFIKKVVDRRNRLVQEKLGQERPHLQLLPPAPVPEYVNHRARVRKWSTIQAAGRTYTVPSRLIGQGGAGPAVRRAPGSVLQGPPGGTDGNA